MITKKKLMEKLEGIEKRLDALSHQVLREVGYKQLAETLQEQNRELFKQVLARDLPELQTYTNWTQLATQKSYDPLSDVANAGSIVEISDET